MAVFSICSSEEVEMFLDCVARIHPLTVKASFEDSGNQVAVITTLEVNSTQHASTASQRKRTGT